MSFGLFLMRLLVLCVVLASRCSSRDQVVKKMGKLSIPMLRNISRQVCKGLKHMHFRKLIHRDIKPANVLIDNEGNCKVRERAAGTRRCGVSAAGALALTGCSACFLRFLLVSAVSDI